MFSAARTTLPERVATLTYCDCPVGSYEVIDRPVFEKLRTVEPCVDEDSVPAAANQPDHHGDVQLSRFVRAFDETGDREVRNRCVADGVHLIFWRLPESRKQK